ncbi:MAG: hypothetical protein K8R85_00065 [Bacteroidetes bacterium]|nr:hypothetical protein [Bacteroidota bacterium]
MKSLIYLNKYFLKYKWRLLLGVLFVGISNYFAVDGFIYAGQAVDFIKNNINNPDKDFLIHELVQYALIIIGLAILSGVFLFFTRQTIIVMSRLVEFDLKNMLGVYDCILVLR